MYSTHIMALSLLVSGAFLMGTSTPPTPEVAQPQPATVTAKAVKGGMVIELDSEEQFNELINSGAVVVVDIYSAGCPPCQKFAPTFAKVAASLTDVIFVKISGPDFMKLVNELLVSGFPTILVYKNGKQVGKYKGDRSVSDFTAYVQKMAAA